MIDISNLNIEQVKLFADSTKYFNLFEKYITGEYKKCLLYMIGNPQVIANIMRRNIDATYYIYDNGLIVDWLKVMMSDYKNFHVMLADNRKIDNKKLWAGIKRMKFDKIIMNPPYSKNLHLKILEEAIEHLSDDGKCINLSPIRWLQDPFRNYKSHCDYKKFEDSISKHLENIDILNAKKCNECFNIELYTDLAVYTLCKKYGKFEYQNIWKYALDENEVELFEKISKLKTKLKDKIEHGKRDGIRVLIAEISGNRGTLPVYKDLSYVIDGCKDGKDWTKCKKNGGYEKEEGIGIPNSIKFDTEIEANNFYKSCNTKFYRFISDRYILDQHIPLCWLPFMEDYTHSWDDEDFFKFFNINDEFKHKIETYQLRKDQYKNI